MESPRQLYTPGGPTHHTFISYLVVVAVSNGLMCLLTDGPSLSRRQGRLGLFLATSELAAQSRCSIKICPVKEHLLPAP